MNDWLLENAEAPIRYRVARELVKDEQLAKSIEPELLEHKEVQKWLKNLSQQCIVHGSFDICLENAIPKLVQLGLHGGLQSLTDAAEVYINRFEDKWISANIFSLAGIKNDEIKKFMLEKLDMIHRFVQMKTYDFYLSDEERDELTCVPINWRKSKFIKPELTRRTDFSYPYIYDILGMFCLYDLNDPAVDQKINDVIDYISTDEFNANVADGYGILIYDNKKYYSQGWDPKYPGWFDAAGYDNMPKLLFFAQNIVKYPSARKTKWFGELMNYLESFKNEEGRYIFPAKWFKEMSGYAVQGNHMSLGETKYKRNWCEIESTFYMLLLKNY
ncbi:MAG: hypothetical protein FWF15_11995 [Oscillospiraceae bacterium]|nr:hypothetical protein [Oscillospiraceae bacterium]